MAGHRDMTELFLKVKLSLSTTITTRYILVKIPYETQAFYH